MPGRKKPPGQPLFEDAPKPGDGAPAPQRSEAGGLERNSEAATTYPADRGLWRGLIRRIGAVTSSSDPEDLLNSAFIKLQEYSARADVQNPKAFLFRTAVNLAHDERRQRRGKVHVEHTDPSVGDISDDRPLQDEVFEARERLARVQAALGALHPRTREIFLLHRVDKLKYREIADQLGITVSAVEKHVAKAVLFLAKRMKGG